MNFHFVQTFLLINIFNGYITDHFSFQVLTNIPSFRALNIDLTLTVNPDTRIIKTSLPPTLPNCFKKFNVYKSASSNNKQLVSRSSHFLSFISFHLDLSQDQLNVHRNKEKHSKLVLVKKLSIFRSSVSKTLNSF